MRLLLLTLLLPLVTFNYAQQNNTGCGTDELHQLFLQNVQNLKKHEQIEQMIYNAQVNGLVQPAGRNDFVLPVVVHIIHNNGTENISDAQAALAIDYMNEAFRNTNLYDSTIGVNTNIQFCLAKKNPQGQATTGINRIQSALTELDMSQDLQMKNLSRWDPVCYVNVWVVKRICNQGSCNIGGYAYFPSAHGTPRDGMVVLASTMGTTPAATGTLIHEAGHYLGLYHTFQGGCTNNNCLVDGDRVCDTPPDASTSYIACNSTMNSCTTDVLSGFTTDQPDMHKNYLDYTLPTCRTMFTAGQRDRMQWHITNVRSSLLNCAVCLDPCTTAIAANFATSAKNVGVGTTVNFTNQSSGAATYRWTVNGTQFATTPNANYQFNTQGTYIIRLDATGADPNCVDFKLDTVKVSCGVNAVFSTSNLNPAVGQQVTFKSLSTGATSNQWFVDGVLQGTGDSLNYTFNQGGSYAVYLISSSNLCSDTTSITNFIQVGPPCNISFSWTPQQPNNCLDVTYKPDTTCNYSSYLWTFCEPNYLDSMKVTVYPTSVTNASAPAGAKIIRDNDGNYFAFFCLYNASNSQCLRRMAFGNSINNTPVIDTVITNGAGSAANLHGFDVVYHEGKYTGYMIFFNHIYRVDFGASLTNKNPVLTQLTGITGGTGWGHKIEIVRETNNWWLIVAARNSSAITLLFLGNSLTNSVQAQSSHTVNACAGFSYHKVNGRNYIYAASLFDGLRTISFGNSFANTPTLSPYTKFGTFYHDDLALYQNCDGSLSGVVLMENGTVHRLIRYDTAGAVPVSLDTFSRNVGRISGMSRLIRTDVGLTTIATQGSAGGIVKLSFADCGIPFSTLKFPPPVAYNFPGNYFVRLAVDEGLPTQQVFCQNVSVQSLTGNPVNLGPDTTLCYSGVRTLNAGSGYKTYLWHDGVTDSFTTVFGGGKYYVEVEDYCGNKYTDTMNITVDSATVIRLGNDTTICRERSVVLNAGTMYESFKWEPSAGLSCDTCSTTTATPTATTTYSVTGKTKIGCTSAASITVNVDICLSLNDAFSINKVYPVPARSQINVMFAELNAPVRIKLFNAVGQMVMENVYADAAQNVVELDVSKLATGVYVLEAESLNQRVKTKVLIE